MADSARATLEIGHPAPHRDRVSGARLYLTIATGPLAWLAQLLIGFAFPSYLCFPDLPRLPGTATAPGWMGWVTGAANLAALALCIVALVASLEFLRKTRYEHHDNSGGVMDAGEGRTRYLSVWAVFSSGLFILAVAVNTLSLFLVTSCP